MNRRISIALLPLVAVLISCEAQKSENPLSPSVAGPIPGVNISTVKLLEPGQGFKVKESQQPIRLLVENATTNGVRPLSYTFEVATDPGFATKVFARAGVPPGDGGRTAMPIDRLELGRGYFWRARAEDGANTGQYAAAQFEVLPRPVITPAAALSPVNNERVSNRRPTLRVRNAQGNAAVGPLSYQFVIAKDQAFTQISSSGTVGEGAGETTWASTSDLDFNLTHFWRVRVTDGETTSDWIQTQVFLSPLQPAPAPPGPNPPPNPGGPCNSSNPEAIVQCERAKFGHMNDGQMLEFMRNVARSLNRNAISGGPFGILRKQSGHNCGGYSCDIICAGSGNSQRQYDVLGDIDGAQTAGWGGPKVFPDIRVDVCEVQ